MANITLDDIQAAIAAYADEDPVVANINSSDYTLRRSFINQSIREYQEATDWQHLYKEYNVLVSAATGNASIALPADFRKPASYPVVSNSGATDLFPETKPQAAGQYDETTKRVEFLGNANRAYTMRVYGVTLSSGASIKIPYFSSAVSLASPADITDIPDSNFLVKRSLAYMLESRDDPRFIEMKNEADRILSNMIDREGIVSVANDENRVKTANETRHGGYRIGGW